MPQNAKTYQVQKLSSKLSLHSPEALRFRDFHKAQKEPIAFLQDFRMGLAYAKQGQAFARYIVEADGEIVATAMARHYRKLKLGYEAWITHGPVFAEHLSPEEITAVTAALCREIFSDWRCLAVLMTPYYSEEQRPGITAAMLAAGLENQGQKLDMTVINHLYLRDLATEPDLDTIVAGYEGNLRRALPKAREYGVHWRNLENSEIDFFHQLLSDTADRKEFFMQDQSYFRAMREAFGEDCLLAVIELDLAEFTASQEAIIAEVDAELAELEGKENKRAEGKRKMLSIRRDSTLKRLAEAAEFSGEKVPLAALFCIRSGREITTIFGGRYQRFNYVRGNSILNHELLAMAYREGCVRFNFYGTLELEEAAEGYGNYEFKKGFGGHIEVLAGKFYRARPLLKWLGR